MKYTSSYYAHFLFTEGDPHKLLSIMKSHWVLPWLPNILAEYEALVQKHERVVKVLVKTAYALTPDMKERIEALVKRYYTEKKPFFTFVIDKSIIGNFQVEAQDMVMQASLKSQLTRLFM